MKIVKPVTLGPAAALDTSLSSLLAEVLGLGALFVSQMPTVQLPVSAPDDLSGAPLAANDAAQPVGPAFDDLFDNVPV